MDSASAVESILTGPENSKMEDGFAKTNGTSEISGQNGDQEKTVCYDELFPALPGGGLGGSQTATTNGNNSGAKPSSWGLAGSKSVPAVRSVNKTEFFVIVSEERRHKDLPGSAKFGGDGDPVSVNERKIVFNIGTNTNTSIELYTSKTDGGLTVVITGKASCVADAKKQITAQLVREGQIDLLIPKEYHRHILGAKAAKLKKLEEETATKIIVPRPDENSDVVSIKGAKDGIAVAAHKIQTLADELAKNDREVIEVEKKFHVFIQGPNNKRVESIRQKTGTKIRIPPAIAKDDNLIVVTGEKEGVAEAKRTIVAIYNDCMANIKDTSMQVPKEQHKYILGRGGQTLQDMFESTGVWIECSCLDSNHTKVPPHESDSETIKLLGEPGKLGKALSLVYEKANSVQRVNMNAPAWLHKYLIGKKGENINRLRENFQDAFVEFVDNTIRLDGPKDSIEAVRQMLQTEIDQITSKTVCVELIADVSHHPHIIGKNGSNVNRLKQELNVKIHIPSAEEENAQVITIEGDPEGVKKAKKELEEMIRKLKNETAKELKCESRLHGQIIGQGGEKINEMRNKFNQVNITVPSATKHLDVITIRGDKRDVDQCYAAMESFVRELERTNYKLDVMLYKQFVRYLQNPKGRGILQTIQRDTSTKISLPKDGSGSELVSIVGEKEKTLKAKQRLVEEQKKNSDIVEKQILIPNKLHGALLKSRKALLNSILEEAGCAANDIDVEFPANGSNSDKCIISGPKDMVDKAISRLTEEANERQLAGYSEEVKAKPQYMKYLIGRKGANILKLREKTSARVIFPAEEGDDRETIVIIGREQAVKAARKELEGMIAALENDTEDTVQIPVKYHKFFVARRGEILDQVAEEFGGVQVSFPKGGSDIVTIKGAKEFVAGAKQNLLDRTKELDNQVTINCVIAQVHHRSVMGAKGVRVQGITKEFGVQIKFPERQQPQQNGEEAEETAQADDNDSRNVILITGQKERCEGAAKALQDLVPISVEVPVDASLHKFIIGQKGKDIRELMDNFDVNVKVPAITDEIHSVRIIGPADNVAKCRVELEERIKKLQGDEEDRKLRSFTLKFDVPSKHHPKIVGRKGAVVSKIRDRHDVQIQFPAKNTDESSDTITVQGYEQNTCAARDEILKMVQDLESMVTENIKLDHRCHSRIIGQRGRHVRKIMEDYQVEIKFPRSDAADPDLVEVTGMEDNVYEAVQYLKNQEDELMDSVQEETQYQRPRQETLNNIFEAPRNHGHGRQGFVVQGAPWQSVPDSASQQDFPSFGDRAQNGSGGVAWGPRR